jgi:ML domain
LQNHATFPSSCVNKVEFSADMIVKEDISGELVLTSEVNRCSLDLKTCEKFSVKNFRDFCNKYMTNHLIFSAAFSSFEPQLSCPVKAGNYTLKKTAIDLSIFSIFPIDGFVYLGSYQIVAGTQAKREPVLCVNYEVKIVKTRKLAGCS